MSKLPKLNLRHNFPLLLALVVVTAAIPLTIFVAITQNMENRSRAGGGETPSTFALTDLPIVEFGAISKTDSTIPPINYAGSPNPPTQVISTPSAINCDPLPPNCVTSSDGSVGCTAVMVPPDRWCLPPSAPITVTNYFLQTRDSRAYSLLQNFQTSYPCDGPNCPKRPVHNLDLEQYLGKTVMIEGILKPSALGITWTQPYPLPTSGQLLVNNIHLAQLTQANTNQDGYLQFPYSYQYNNENVYYFDSTQTPPTTTPITPTPTPCALNQPCSLPPVNVVIDPIMATKPTFYVRTPFSNLNYFAGLGKVRITGDEYLVDSRDKFIDINGGIYLLNNSTPTLTPTPTPSSCNGIFGFNICPAWAPPRPGWCDNGQVVTGKTDNCGCQQPPVCISPTPTVSPLGQVNLFFDPSSLNVSTNSPFTSLLQANTNNSMITAVDISLQFDPSVLSITSLSPSSFIPRVLSPTNIDNTNGHAHITLGVDPNKPMSASSVTLLILNGKSKNSNKSSVINVTSESKISIVGSTLNALGSSALISVTIKQPIPGDLDGNGVVDIFDYNTLVTNFGKTNCGNPADTDGNCKVDIFDYNNLVTNFGKRSTTPTPFVTATPSPTPTPTPSSCQSLWWFDNNNRYCSNMTFCGNYQYSGLQTFTTQQACQNALSVSSVTPTPTPTISPTPTPNSVQAAQPHITSVEPTTIYLNMAPGNARLQIQGTGFLSGSNGGAGPIYRSLYLEDYRGIIRYINQIGSANEITFPTWTDTYIDTGIFSSGQIQEIRGGSGNPFVYQPVKVFVEVYDYAGGHGRRSLGISNPLYITIK